MKLLRTISNSNFGQPDTDQSIMRKRDAARAVVFDENDNVAILSVKVGSYHKIPGGGVKDGEDIKEALQREVKEEAGVAIEITDEVGYILEFREGLKQYSYCYLGRLKGRLGKTGLTKNEVRDGFSAPIWMPIDQAIELCKKDKPSFLRAQFMSLRDRIFLEEAGIILKKTNN